MGTSQVQVPQALAQQGVLHERVHNVVALLDVLKAHQGLLQPHLQPWARLCIVVVELLLRHTHEAPMRHGLVDSH